MVVPLALKGDDSACRLSFHTCHRNRKPRAVDAEGNSKPVTPSLLEAASRKGLKPLLLILGVSGIAVLGAHTHQETGGAVADQRIVRSAARQGIGLDG